MLPKEYWQACKLHDWDWRDAKDDSVVAKGYANEAKLKALAFESPALNEIWVRFRWKHELEALKEVQS